MVRSLGCLQTKGATVRAGPTALAKNVRCQDAPFEYQPHKNLDLQWDFNLPDLLEASFVNSGVVEKKVHGFDREHFRVGPSPIYQFGGVGRCKVSKRCLEAPECSTVGNRGGFKSRQDFPPIPPVPSKTVFHFIGFATNRVKEPRGLGAKRGTASPNVRPKTR